jgi:hypothetical protein
MRVTRKMQSLTEAKIRHAIATGPLPHIEPSSTSVSQQRRQENKSDTNEAGQSK